MPRHEWKPFPLIDGAEYCSVCNHIRNPTSDERPCPGPQRLRAMEKPQRKWVDPETVKAANEARRNESAVNTIRRIPRGRGK